MGPHLFTLTVKSVQISFRSSSEVASSETAPLRRHLPHPRRRDSPLNQPEWSDKEDKRLE